MSVGVMKDYKRRDLHASHTLVLIDLIIWFLGLIIKAFDNQTESWA